MFLVSEHHSAFLQFDCDVCARRAVIHFVFDVKVLLNERDDFLGDFCRLDDFVVRNDSAYDRSDSVVAFKSVVSRSVNLIVCKQGFVSCLHLHFHAADKHVVHLVCGDVCIGHAVG